MRIVYKRHCTLTLAVISIDLSVSENGFRLASAEAMRICLLILQAHPWGIDLYVPVTVVQRFLLKEDAISSLTNLANIDI